MSKRAPTERFSERVELYVKYRPSYPTAVLYHLQAHFGLRETAVVADIGSGTGISSRLFLENGNRVIGVEPNREMREAGERFLAGYERFSSVEGKAEATTLPDNAVDWVVAGQAFHWFDPAAARAEFRRILRPQGNILLMWNVQDETEPLMAAYTALLKQYSLDYEQTSHKRSRKADEQSLLGEGMETAEFVHHQQLDYQGFEGRALSSSYTPLPQHKNHAPFVAGLKELFRQFAKNGRVFFRYKTRLYIG